MTTEKLSSLQIINCDKCNGTGKQPNSYAAFSEILSQIVMVNICKKCHGNGYLDWIENIIGKKRVPYIPRTLFRFID